MKMIVFNHKMNLEYDYVYEYIDKLNGVSKDVDIVVCPSNIYLTDFVNNLNWGVGVQNFDYREMGDYTGQVNLLQVKSVGCEYAIVGHSEVGDSLDDVNLKLKACLDSNIIPILCIGNNGYVLDELDGILKDIQNINFIIFAYEPLNKLESLSISDIHDDIKVVYKYLYDKYKVSPNIIYGGDVYEKDMAELLLISELNGVIVGSVSSNIESCLEIIDRI